jgi:hypothetical protein
MDGARLRAGRLVWQIKNDEDIHAPGSAATPPTPHCDNVWIDLPIRMPTDLAKPRIDTTLSLRYEIDGGVRSENTYEIVITTQAWAHSDLGHSIALFDPADAALLLRRESNVKPIQSFSDFDLRNIVVVADAAHALSDSKNVAAFHQFVESGGRALLLGAGSQLPICRVESRRRVRIVGAG